jgi:hypothetical protein
VVHKALVFLVCWGVAAHLILASSAIMLVKGVISSPIPAEVAQLVNAGLLLLVPWLAERWLAPSGRERAPFASARSGI